MRRALAAAILAFPLLVPPGLVAQSDLIATRFERYLNALRRQAGIPGLAAAIVQDDRIAWETALGYRDLEASIPVTPDTPFYIADLTSTVSATLLLNCVEQGRTTLDETVVMAPALPDSPPTIATVQDLLTHTTGGRSFRYDPSRFTALTPVIERCYDDSFKEAVGRRLLNRLGMTRSLPGIDVATIEPSDFDEDQVEAYRTVLSETAKPYRVDRRGRATLSQYPTGTLDAASGLISSTRDLARFTIALDTHLLLAGETLDTIWALPQPPARTRFGLGWFVQVYNGQPVVWHFGYAPDASSALFVHLPARHKTLILLANSDGLSADFSLANGDLTTSPFARLFLSLFG